MFKNHPRLTTPSMAVALLALVLALSGTALAGGPIAFVAKTLGLNGKQKGQVTKIADKEVGKKASKLHVSFASTAGSAATAGSATNATNASNATNATNATNAANAANAGTVGGQTVAKVNANVAIDATQVVFNSDSLVITVSCLASTPEILAAGPSDAELNWGGNANGTAFGGVDDRLGTGDDITSANGRGVTTFAYSTFASNLAVTGTIGFDDPNTHDNSFVGCSFFGTILASS